MLDEKFLKILRDKLAIGSTSSSLLNCIPGTSLSKVDAFDFNLIQDGLAGAFVEQLFTEEKFTFNISYQDISEKELEEEKKLQLELLSKKLTRIFNDNELSFQEKGHRTFGFGYPLFVMEVEDSWVRQRVGAKEKGKRIICAPLFIWPLDIQKSYRQNRTWTIKKSSESAPFLNDTFVSFIKQKRQIDLMGILGNDLEELLTYQVIEKKVSSIIRAVNTYDKKTTEIFMPTEHIFPLHSKDELKEKATINGYIEWSGVFSLYSKQKQNLINEIDLLIEKKEEFTIDQETDNEDKTPSVFTHGFTATNTDHSQQAVIDRLNKDNKFIIQGPPGTGKSQTLTALITNALSNGAKCLVVCEKTTALDVIYDNLNNLGLGDLCAFINDPLTDRRKIVDKVRSTPLLNYPRFFDSKFNQLTSELQSQIDDLSKGYEAIASIIWEDQTWSNMLGRYLKAKKTVKNNPLKEELKQIDWELVPSEYHHYMSMLSKLQELTSKKNLIIEEELNNRFFSDERKGFVKETIQDICVKQINLVNEIKDQFEKLPIKYKECLEEYYEEANEDIIDLFDKFNKYYDQLKKIDPSILQLPPVSLKENLKKVISLFSPKTKKALEYRERLLKLYVDIQNASSKIADMKFDFLSDPKFMTIRELKDSLDSFKQIHDSFISKLEKFIGIKIFKLLKENQSTEGGGLEMWNNINEEYKFYIEKLNKSKLFNKDISFEKNTNYYNQLTNVNSIISSLENVSNRMKYFSAFYDFQSFFIKLDEKEKIVAKIFAKLNSNDKLGYISLFDHFYLQKILLNNEKLDLPKDTKKLETLYQKIEELKKILVNKALSTFSKAQWDSISSFPGYRSLYNIRGAGGQRRNSLRQIINHNFNFFCNFFPVILTNPTACATLFPLKQDIFNMVIFDEASQLRLEDTYSSLLRGKIKIISGDQHQMPPPRAYEPSDTGNDDENGKDEYDKDEDEEKIVEGNIIKSLANSESLLDYVITKGYKKTPLLVHYRSNHSALIEFSNNAFYSGNLLPIIKNKNYIPIINCRVNGLYTQRTNPAEADKAIEILDELVDIKKGTCPSVGIATFNLFQRDLINEKLSKKAASDSIFAEKLQILNSNRKPLFVKNLENIQGDERDVIIITTTFGKDAEGKFRKHFGPLNNKNGYRLLNVIVTRAKDKVFVCTSIPEEEIFKFESELKKKGKNDGVPIVLAYLAYANAVSEGNIKEVDHILSVLKSLSTEERVLQPQFIGTESPFEEEVYEEMTHIINNPKRITSQKWIGAFRVDFLINPKDDKRKPLVIECDGAAFHGSTEAYAYDYFRTKQLRSSGYVVHKIWSTNWWDEEEYLSEINALKDLFEEYDKEPKVGSMFYKSHTILPTDPVVTNEIRKLIENDNKEAQIVTGFITNTNTSEEDEVIEIITEIKEKIKFDNKNGFVTKTKLKSHSNQQSSLFSVSFDNISTNKDIWFKLSHWGKETGKLNGFQNRACYSLGIYITQKKKLTEKQGIYGRKLLDSAIAKGFINIK